MAVGGYLNQGFNKYSDTLSLANLGALNSEVIDAIYKKWYLPSVRDQLNNKKILSRIIPENTEDVAGEEAVMLLNIGRNWGVGSIDTQGKLPDPMKQQYVQARYRMRYNYGRILFNGPAQAAARNDRGAFIRVMDGEIKGLARDMQVMINRIMFGDGTGRLARLVATSGTTYTVDSPGGPSVSNYGLGTQYLEEGMRVVVWRDNAGTLTINDIGSSIVVFQIRSVDYQNGTITFNAQGSAAAATLTTAPSAGTPWYMSLASEFGTSVNEIDTAMFNEQFGLAAIISDTDVAVATFGEHGGVAAGDTVYDYVGGITPTAALTAIPQVPKWRSYILDNNGTPIPYSEDLFRQAVDGVDQLGDGSPEVWVTTHGIRRQAVNAQIANKRYVNTTDMAGGYSAITIDGRALIPDKDCMRGRAYGLDTKVLHKFVCQDFYWLDKDGHVLHRLENKDAYQACLAKYWNFGTDARNRLCAVFDIADS